MERDRRQAEAVEEDEMDTSGHGDALQGAVDKVADRPARPDSGETSLDRVEEEDMDTSGHGDPQRKNVSRD